MPGPLSHLTILDLSRMLAGPWCTQLLADLGALVIKIEKPGTGDDTRAWAPPYLQDEHVHDTTESAYYLGRNRGKLSVAIDFTQAEGRDLVRALAQQSDALVENFKVGGLARHGLDYASVAAINPRLVYASITGFGQDGPYAERAGYDFIIQPRFAKNADRVRQRALLAPMIERVIATRTQHDWLAALEEAGVPAETIAQLAARNVVEIRPR